jgi:hypothetical protein
MSEKSFARQMALTRQIWQLDKQFDLRVEAAELSETSGSAAGRCRIQQARRLRETYKSGHIPRPSLPPPHSQEVRAPEIPWDLLNSLEARPTNPAFATAIPDDVLWPKRKRGRPRNKALQALANSQRCSIRHARRLLASGKQRERVREHLSPTEEWALQQRKKRAKLVQALEQELSIDQLAYWLNLSYHWEAYTTGLENGDDDLVDRLLSVEPNSWARQLAERMAAEKGSLAASGFVRQSLGLQPSVSVSRSTISEIPSVAH